MRRRLLQLVALVLAARLAGALVARRHGPWESWRPPAARRPSPCANDFYARAIAALPHEQARGVDRAADVQVELLLDQAVRYPYVPEDPSFAGLRLLQVLGREERREARLGHPAAALVWQLESLRVMDDLGANVWETSPSAILAAAPARVATLGQGEVRGLLKCWHRTFAADRGFAERTAAFADRQQQLLAEQFRHGSHGWYLYWRPEPLESAGPLAVQRWLLECGAADYFGTGRRDTWRLASTNWTAVTAWAHGPFGPQLSVPQCPGGLFDPGFWQARRVRCLTGQTLRRELLVALALRGWRVEHGRWPRRLDQLVPGWLDRVPADPFAEQPLRYRLEHGQPLLYSVGPDRRDQGGLQVRFGEAGVAADSVGDLVWGEPRLAQWMKGL